MGLSATSLNQSRKVFAEAEKYIGSAVRKTSSKVETLDSTNLKTIPIEIQLACKMPLKPLSKLVKMNPDVAVATKESVVDLFELGSSKNLSSLFSQLKGKGVEEENIFNLIKLQKINNKEIKQYLNLRTCGEPLKDVLDAELLTHQDLVRMFAEDVQNYSVIKNHPIFSAYNLSLAETAKISDCMKQAYFNVSDITSVLKKKNPDLFKKLGGDVAFDEVNGVNPAYKSLKELQSTLHGEKSIKHVIDKSEYVKSFGVDINGETKSFIYSGQLGNGSLKPPVIGNNEVKTLIKSNMVTMDLLENKEFLSFMKKESMQKLLKDSKINYETPVGELVKEKVDFFELVDKAINNGINSLSSNEIHSLTDGLSTVFDALPKDVQAKFSSLLEEKGTKIYSVVQDLKDSLTKSCKGNINKKNGLLQVGNVEFEDHFFMRMLDRNLANVVDNNTGELLSLDKFMSVIIKKAQSLKPQKTGNFTMNIDGIEGHGVKIIGKFDNEKLVIDSIMQ